MAYLMILTTSLVLLGSSHAAMVILQGTGIVVTNSGFGLSPGDSALITVQYDDSAPAVALGGVGLVFQAPLLIRLQSAGRTWEGAVDAPADSTIIFNDEEVEDAVLFSLSVFNSAVFSTIPAGIAANSMRLEITGDSGWFTGVALPDLAQADFSTANTATLNLSGAGSSFAQVSLDLASFAVVPEPTTSLLASLALCIGLLKRRR
jgi:hypothetical protein